MAPQTTFPLSLVVDVSVNIASVGATPPTFNQGLIVGSSPVIPSVGANSRVRQYTGLAGMTSDGFSISDPEYIAAQIYFSPTPAAQFVNIGRQDLTAIATAVPHAADGGAGYVVGDVVTVVQSEASLGQLTVLTIGEGGVVLTLGTTVGNQGTGYAAASALTTTGGTGASLEVDITTGETVLQAVTACRIASPNWYLAGACGATDSDYTAVAAYSQAATPQMQFVGNSSTLAIANATPGNLALTLQAANYNRFVGQYATTQSGAFPNQAYFFAAFMGVAMGLNTGLAGSYFTMAFKQMPGMVTEPLSNQQRVNVGAANFNLYVSIANSYSWELEGVVPNGQYFDEVLFLDMLASNIQYACANVFSTMPSVPQNNGGQSLLENATAGSCNALRSIGFIAQNGTWSGPTVLGLTAGTALPNGFLVQSPAFTSPKPAARAMMPIYVSFIEAGSGQSLTVGVYVQR